MNSRVVAVVAGAHLAALGGCAAPDQTGSPAARLFPRVTPAEAGGVHTFEFGPDSLTTTDNSPWEGRAAAMLPPIFDPAAGPITVEVRGLDLSGIRYTGDMGTPADSTDRGAYVDVALFGPTGVVYRIHSYLVGVRTLWTGKPLELAAIPKYRAYVIYRLGGWMDAGKQPVGGNYRFNVEAWGGDSIPDYDTFDLHVQLARRAAFGSLRLHRSWSWDNGNSAAGGRCPWNIAMNTVVAGTADSVWHGQCTAAAPGATGRAHGGWVSADSTPLPQDVPLRGVQAGLAIVNWAYAAGPYHVSWDNLVVTGRLADGANLAVGRGWFIPIETSDPAQIPAGGAASFSFLAAPQAPGRPGTAHLRFRTSTVELASTNTEWVVLESLQVSFAGEARVNGTGGYRYELHAADGGNAHGQDRLSLRIWRAGASAELPAYVGFGTLSGGDIRVDVPSQR